MQSKTWIWIVLAVVVVAGGFWWWQSSEQGMMMGNTSAPMQTASTTTTTNTASSTGTSVSVTGSVTTGSTAPMSASVTYNGSSFSPSSVTIAEGGTVTWTSTAGPIWVASNPHPIHNGYDGTTMEEHCAPGYTGAAPFDECGSATSWSFTFNQVGTWGYHDHLNAGVMGSVTVVAQ